MTTSGNPPPSRTPFTPIAQGSALSVMVETIYPGNTQHGAGILVLSETKSSGYTGPPATTANTTTGSTAPLATGAAAQMLNFFRQHAPPKESLVPSAEDAGTSVIQYLPSLTGDLDLEIQIQMLEHRLVDQILGDLSSLIEGSEGLPVFKAGPHAFLIGQALKFLDGLAKILDPQGGKTILNQSYTVRLSDPGFYDSVAGFKAIYAESANSEFQGYSPQLLETGGGMRYEMADSNQAPYAGDAPYLIVRIDGTVQPALQHFSTYQASAALLNQLYNQGQAGQVVTSVLEPALNAYSDVESRSVAEGYLSQLRSLATTMNAMVPNYWHYQEYETQFNQDLAKFNQDLARFNAWSGQIQNQPLQIANPQIPTTPTIKPRPPRPPASGTHSGGGTPGGTPPGGTPPGGTHTGGTPPGGSGT